MTGTEITHFGLATATVYVSLVFLVLSTYMSTAMLAACGFIGKSVLTTCSMACCAAAAASSRACTLVVIRRFVVDMLTPARTSSVIITSMIRLTQQRSAPLRADNRLHSGISLRWLGLTARTAAEYRWRLKPPPGVTSFAVVPSASFPMW